MKKFLLTLVFALAVVISAKSQCTPVQFSSGLVSPDTSVGLPYGAATQYYEAIINIRVPEDTTLPGFPIPIGIDSAGIVSVTGLPSSMTWTTNSPSNYWQGGTFGCIAFTGTPTVQDVGTHSVVISGIVYFLTVPYSFTYEYELVILDATHVGFSQQELKTFTVKQNSPNPFDKSTTIRFSSTKSQMFTFEVFDMVGNKVEMSQFEAIAGVNQIIFDRKNLKDGVYLFKLTSGQNSIVKRMIIN